MLGYEQAPYGCVRHAKSGQYLAGAGVAKLGLATR